MELYKNSDNRTITIDVPLTPVLGTGEVAIVGTDGLTIADLDNLDTSDGISTTIPFNIVENYDEFTVRVRFEYMEQSVTYAFERDIYVDVITPILTIAETKAIIGTGKTDQEALDAERLVRFIIYSHCGQEFNRTRKMYRIHGTGKNYIPLPARLIRLTKFNEFETLPYNFYLSADGWFIRGGMRGVPNIKADYYGLHEINGRVYNEYNVLPEWFRESEYYRVEGIWGWDEVPAEVKQAAKILLVDYGCDDSIYRDRYVQDIQSVDWRISFDSGAYAKTGNVKADQLLSKFVSNRGWAVV